MPLPEKIFGKIEILRPPTYTEVPARHFDVTDPDDVDFSRFGDDQKAIATIYTSLTRWLGLPYIFDNFETHEHRTVYRDMVISDKSSYAALPEEREQIKKSMTSNKLTTSSLTAIKGFLEHLQTSDSKDHALLHLVPATKHILELIEPAIREKEPQIRKQNIEKLEDAVAAILQRIADVSRKDRTA